jgi:hypothetical protein
MVMTNSQNSKNKSLIDVIMERYIRAIFRSGEIIRRLFSPEPAFYIGQLLIPSYYDGENNPWGIFRDDVMGLYDHCNFGCIRINGDELELYVTTHRGTDGIPYFTRVGNNQEQSVVSMNTDPKEYRNSLSSLLEEFDKRCSSTGYRQYTMLFFIPEEVYTGSDRKRLSKSLTEKYGKTTGIKANGEGKNLNLFTYTIPIGQNGGYHVNPEIGKVARLIRAGIDPKELEPYLPYMSRIIGVVISDVARYQQKIGSPWEYNIIGLPSIPPYSDYPSLMTTIVNDQVLGSGVYVAVKFLYKDEAKYNNKIKKVQEIMSSVFGENAIRIR